MRSALSSPESSAEVQWSVGVEPLSKVSAGAREESVVSAGEPLPDFCRFLVHPCRFLVHRTISLLNESLGQAKCHSGIQNGNT